MYFFRVYSGFSFTLLFSIMLVACSSGGGSQVSGQSLAELQARYDRLRSEAYQGETDQANLNVDSFIAFARFYLSEEPPTAGNKARSLQRPGNSTNYLKPLQHLTVDPVLAKRQVVLDDKPQAGQVNAARIDVNESQPCDDGEGRIHYEGYVSDQVLGSLTVTFENCLSDGEMMNGSGAIYFGDGNQGTTMFYDHVHIKGTFGEFYITGSTNYQSNNVFRSSLVFEEVVSGLTFQMAGIEEHSDYYNGTIVNGGRLYLPDHGFVELAGDFCFSDYCHYSNSGSLTLTGAGSEGVVILSDSYIKLQLNDLVTGSSTGVYISSSFLLSYENQEPLAFLPVDQLSQPPGYTGFQFVETELTTLDSIETEIYTSDPDTVEIFIGYVWLVNDEVVADQETNTLPAGIAKVNDIVTVYAVLDDGFTQVSTESLSLTILDAPASLVIGEVPEQLGVGDTLNLAVSSVDPDTGEAASGAVQLVYGPTGASLADGFLQWQVEDLLFGQEQTFHFGVQIARDDTSLSDIAIKVVDENGMLPIVRAGFSVPLVNYSIWVGQFDSDGKNEILLTDGRNIIYTAEKQGDKYIQDWMYPYQLDGDGHLVQVIGKDLSGDGVDEIIAVTTSKIFVIEDRTKPARQIYQLASGMIEALAIDDLENDGDFELVVLCDKSDTSHSSGNSHIEVVDYSTGMLQFSVNQLSGNNSVVVGNVDNDPAKEIIVNGGYVYDGISGANEWYYAQGFGDHIAVADGDSDGVDDILGAQLWGDITLFSAVTKTSIWSFDNFNTCSLNAGNIDADSQQEFLVGDCQWGNITAYDVSTGAPVVQWQTSMIEHGSKSVTFGDADNDGQGEMIWGSGQSSSGEDVLVVADLDEGSTPWYPNDPAQLDFFTAAGWAQITPSEYRAVFTVPRTDSGYSGQRYVTMTDSGTVNVSAEIASNWDKANQGVAVDYNHDGYSELFLASADLYNGFFTVLNLNDSSNVWGGAGGEYSNNIGVVAAADINGDGFEEAIYSDSFNLAIIDIYAQTLLWSSGDLGSYIVDIVPANIDEDTDFELVVSTNNELLVFNWSGGAYSQQLSVSGSGCQRVVIGELNANLGADIVCLHPASYFSNQSSLTIYDAGLQIQSELTIDGRITDMALTDEVEQQGLLVANVDYSNGYSYYDVSTKNISLLSLDTGNLIWSSPNLLGEVPNRSMYAFSDEGGRQRLTFATTNAMYITR